MGFNQELFANGGQYELHLSIRNGVDLDGQFEAFDYGHLSQEGPVLHANSMLEFLR